MARPPKYTKKYRAELAVQFAEYIESTDIPIIAEFATKNFLPKQTLYDWDEFSNLLKICTTKKEFALESKGLKNEVNCGMAVFSLKQLGWSDKQELEHGGDVASALEKLADAIGESYTTSG